MKKLLDAQGQKKKVTENNCVLLLIKYSIKKWLRQKIGTAKVFFWHLYSIGCLCNFSPFCFETIERRFFKFSSVKYLAAQ